jgi:hypothetical protein
MLIRSSDAAISCGESDANRVGPVVDDYWIYGRLAFEDRGGICRDLLRSESRASGDDRVDLISNGWTADRNLYAVQHIHNMRNFLDSVGNARRRLVQQLGICRKNLDNHRPRLASQVTDHVLENLDEFHTGGWFGFLNLSAHVRDDFVDLGRPNRRSVKFQNC